MNRGVVIFGLLFIVLTVYGMTALAQSEGDFELSWFTVDGGGGNSIGGDFTLSGTVGQPDVGSQMVGGDFTLASGFWRPGEVIEMMCGDDNADGFVNIFDVIIELQIIVGLVEPTPLQEIVGDLNRDGANNIFDVILKLQHILGLTEITECGPLPG